MSSLGVPGMDPQMPILHFKTRGCRLLARNCSEMPWEGIGQRNRPREDMRMTGFVVIGFSCGPELNPIWQNSREISFSNSYSRGEKKPLSSGSVYSGTGRGSKVVYVSFRLISCGQGENTDKLARKSWDTPRKYRCMCFLFSGFLSDTGMLSPDMLSRVKNEFR